MKWLREYWAVGCCAAGLLLGFLSPLYVGEPVVGDYILTDSYGGQWHLSGGEPDYGILTDVTITNYGKDGYRDYLAKARRAYVSCGMLYLEDPIIWETHGSRVLSQSKGRLAIMDLATREYRIIDMSGWRK